MSNNGNQRLAVMIAILMAISLFWDALMATSIAGDANDALTFERDIRPIFRAHGFDCHGAVEEMKGGLDLRLVRLMVKGGESGPAIVTGQPAESFLLERLRSGEMPPGENQVPRAEIAVIEKWIASGAKTARPEPARIEPGLGMTIEERSFWSFQPIRRPAVPEHETSTRVRTPIDAFILSAMPDGHAFAPNADRLTLVLRAYLDLIGLPPSLEDVQRWEKVQDDKWYEKLVDELLESDHYGERWARHWLDVAGYADSEGYTSADANRDWAWKYRDWVIRALNADKPYSQFIIEQLAGDELAGDRSGDLARKQIELLTATGFLRMAADGTGSGANNDDARNQVVTDTIRIVSTALMGVSVHCAQCHDHRYDPIPQLDYYSLRAIFEPALDWKAWRTPAQRRISLYTDADRRKAREVEAEAKTIAAEKAVKLAEYMAQAIDQELKKYDEPLRGKLSKAYNTPGGKRSVEEKSLLKKHPSVNITPGNLYQYIAKSRDELKKYDERISAIRGKKPPEEFLRTLIEPANHAPTTVLFHRGDYRQPKQTVVPAGLTVAAPEGQRAEFPLEDETLPTTGRRLAFAKWLTSGRHPLVARVIVNRVWMHHFGRGLVKTPADFGKLGGRPTHPQLLDWLAAEFMQQGWSLKQLHRLIMQSTVYLQSSEVRDVSVPVSAYTAKPLIRLEAETIRDRMLAVAGTLQPTLFGPPIGIKEDDAGQVIVAEQTRRSLYTRVRRSQPVSLMQAFDAPVMETNCEIRSVSTVATQSLMLLNGDFVLTQATNLASRAEREATPLEESLLATLPNLPPPPSSVWRFGYGQFDIETNQTNFKPLPHWTGNAWQGGPELPDPKLGWVILHAGGGHAGNTRETSAIRRWIAPTDGVVDIAGTLKHPSENGNGVRGLIASSGSGTAMEGVAFHSELETKVSGLAVKKGHVIDFIVDSNGDVTSDSFSWAVTIVLKSADAKQREYSSARDFHGPLTASGTIVAQIVRAWQLALARRPTQEELETATHFVARQIAYLHQHANQLPKGISAEQQALTNVCQALLICNEFLYSD
jgi:mono/diheme cytochrome c family protein